MLLTITLKQRRHRRLRLRNRDTGLQPRGHAHKADSAHEAFLRDACRFEWFVRENFRIAAKPRNRQIRQHTDDGGRDTVERDAVAEHHWIGIETLAPKTFCHHRDVALGFLFRQKIAPEDGVNAEQLEIVRRHIAAEQLHRLARSSHGYESGTGWRYETISPIGRDARKNILS